MYKNNEIRFDTMLKTEDGLQRIIPPMYKDIISRLSKINEESKLKSSSYANMFTKKFQDEIGLGKLYESITYYEDVEQLKPRTVDPLREAYKIHNAKEMLRLFNYDNLSKAMANYGTALKDIAKVHTNSLEDIANDAQKYSEDSGSSYAQITKDDVQSLLSKAGLKMELTVRSANKAEMEAKQIGVDLKNDGYLDKNSSMVFVGKDERLSVEKLFDVLKSTIGSSQVNGNMAIKYSAIVNAMLYKMPEGSRAAFAIKNTGFDKRMTELAVEAQDKLTAATLTFDDFKVSREMVEHSHRKASSKEVFRFNIPIDLDVTLNSNIRIGGCR
jgi:hypothetical protein